jgi:tRNA(Ile)-lysidine synthase
MMISPKFSLALRQLEVAPGGHRVLAALSGGLDSVVLVHWLLQSGFEVILAHCNFNLRGAESQRDEEFVFALSQQLRLPLHLMRFTHHDFEATGGNTQLAARMLRYRWFDELLKTFSAEDKAIVLATAHHANDQAETMLINMARGTGLKGIAGIPQRNGQYIRPLLQVTRAELEAYASAHKLAWVEDSSNEKDNYLRNRVRHQAIPVLEEVFPGYAATLAANAARLSDAFAFGEAAMQQLLQKLVVAKGNERHVPVLKLAKLKPLAHIVHALIAPYGFAKATDTDAAIALLHASTGAYIASATHRIIRNRNWLIIAPLANREATHVLVEAHDKLLQLQAGELKWQYALPDERQVIVDDPNQAFVDSRDIRFPLLLRPWKTGDYFYPLGIQKKKKLARFFIDQKFSKTEKEKCLVLLSENRVVWVIGMRIDNRFRIGPQTREMLHLSWKPS